MDFELFLNIHALKQFDWWKVHTAFTIYTEHDEISVSRNDTLKFSDGSLKVTFHSKTENAVKEAKGFWKTLGEGLKTPTETIPFKRITRFSDGTHSVRL